jgi:broad specificity phosphatase PhoE
VDEIKIYVISHAETDFSAQGRIEGRCNISLNARGKKQAHEFAEALSFLGKNTIIMTSPMKRAKQTAKVIAKHLGIWKYEIVDALTERDYGDFNGGYIDELQQYIIEYKQKWGHDVTPPYSGRDDDMTRRICCFINSLTSNNCNEAIAVLLITHEYVLAELRWFIDGEYGQKIVTEIDNCTGFVYDTKNALPEMRLYYRPPHPSGETMLEEILSFLFRYTIGIIFGIVFSISKMRVVLPTKTIKRKIIMRKKETK